MHEIGMFYRRSYDADFDLAAWWKEKFGPKWEVTLTTNLGFLQITRHAALAYDHIDHYWMITTK